ncbi:MAG: (2Fe-2S)-binding protein [Pseudomonas sp.]|nr:(2Fe-2S)-binding protein [Pseudomonas sp.]
MPADSLFIQLPTDSPCVMIEFEGQPLAVPSGISVAAALLASGIRHTRSTAVSGAPRAPYCMMGVCFECLVEVDGVPNCQACMVTVSDGLKVRRQQGARALSALAEEGAHDGI